MGSLSLPLLLLFLLGLISGQNCDLKCEQVPGALVQIDASNGQVFGVSKDGNIYTLYHGSWTQISGGLTHVTVGPAGVWGVSSNNNIYKLVGGDWVQTNGLLKQIDAGGAQFISGASMKDEVFCLGSGATVSVKDGSDLPWNQIAGKLKYYSCGPWGCWGVSPIEEVFYRLSVTPASCAGSSWQHVIGKLAMIEVGTDGSVYGVTSAGDVFRRDGISECNPVGTSWTQIQYKDLKFRHVAQDLGKLWLLTTDERILRCQL